MIKLTTILLEANVATLTPTNYKLNKLVTKEVWATFLKEMNRVFVANGSKIPMYDPEKVNTLTGDKLNSNYCHQIAWAINKLDKSYKVADTDDYRQELKDAGLKNASDHGFVVKGNKFYDAEAIDGVDDVSQLPYFKRFLDRKKMLEEVSLLDNLKTKFTAFMGKLKQEKKETVEAFKLIVKASKGEITLTDEQKTQIGDQLKDVLKTLGLTAVAVMPGGIIVAVLLKLLKQQNLIIPSAFK
jgi:hypothetical protein